MSISSQCAVAIHALTYIARWEGDRLSSSAEIAESLESNPVLVRRVLGRLRGASLVRSTEGRGGGWRLSRAADRITLDDVYAAVELGPLLALHAHPPNSQCVIGRHIQSILEEEFTEAEAAMRARLRETTIADMLGYVVSREAGLSGRGHHS
ncbi:Rrf2 family transcriptional regulator [Spiractinospora alimapuensis]|uniref:Rrf2 family transcriptional regulator n=1 Tax=Spiractinospora alimapuensis TaxID=2820884 RepID=UPI001F1A6A30|nr:Rrf2 family transcriptional regulator [Spiractinospora alimapuensis]QVQ51238.1 Rrf2 family transcriptional regulator [Spiractinospora alimapuensis]